MIDFCRGFLDTRLGDVEDKLKGDKGANSPVILHNLAVAQLPKEILIVGDNDELEVGVILPLVDDTRGALAWRLISQGDRAYSTKLAAKASMFSVSKAFVGSSRANMPQFCPKESDKARRIMIDASIFCPAEHLPRMSIST